MAQPHRSRHTGRPDTKREGGVRGGAGRRPTAHGQSISERSRVSALVADFRVASTRFFELWDSPGLGDAKEQSRHKVIDHREVGRISLDCDILVVARDDLRIIVYTAEPGSEDSERLALAIVLGTQDLVT